MDESRIQPLRGRPGTSCNGNRAPPRPADVPAEMNDLAYLVNQVQRRTPPIMRAHARYADDRSTGGEPTVLVINTDTGELVWRVPLTGLLQLAARFLRMNPRLIIGHSTPDIPEDEPRLPQRPSRPSMNDLAYLVNSVGEQRRPVIRAHAEFDEHGEGEEPTVRIVNSATAEVVLSVQLRQLLNLAAKLKMSSGLVFQAQG